MIDDHNEAIERGINAVPTVVIADDLALPGALDLDALPPHRRPSRRRRREPAIASPGGRPSIERRPAPDWRSPRSCSPWVLQSTGPIIVKDATAPGLTFAFHRLWVAAVVMVLISTATGKPLTRRVLKASFLGGLLFAR